MSRDVAARVAIAALGAVLAAVAAVLVGASPDVTGTWPVVVVAVSVLLPFGVAEAIWGRGSDRRMAWLLVAVGVSYFVRSFGASQEPVIYATARAVGQFGEVLLLWVMLGFPTGRLGDRASRGVVLVGALTIVLLWWPVIALSGDIPAAGPLVPCAPDCPDNALRIAHASDVADVFTVAFRASAAALLLAVAWILAGRLRRATPITRRMLAPVLVASVARTVAVAAFLALGSPAFVRGFLVLTYWAIPVAIVIGLLRGRAYDAAALERLVQGLRSRPGPEHLRTVMAEALADPSLDIVYWIPDAASYTDASGAILTLPAYSSGRAVTRVSGADGEPTAALLHDPALLDHPGLLDATIASTAIALESNRLEAEIAAVRSGTITAVDAERRRIERDLHDGAQQRLIALRMKLAVAERLIGRDSTRARALLGESGGDIDAALAEVRALAHGIAPPTLVEGGLASALAAAARSAPLATRLDASGVARYAPDVKTAVYFSCIEALQNAAKHAGPGASITVRLRGNGDHLVFEVQDDGVGFDPADVGRGRGLSNIRDRLAAVHGSAEIDAAPGAGTRLVGRVPTGPPAVQG